MEQKFKLRQQKIADKAGAETMREHSSRLRPGSKT